MKGEIKNYTKGSYKYIHHRTRHTLSNRSVVDLSIHKKKKKMDG